MLAQAIALRSLECEGVNSYRETIKVTIAPGSSVEIREYVQPPPNPTGFKLSKESSKSFEDRNINVSASVANFVQDTLIKAEKSPDCPISPGKGLTPREKRWSSGQASRATQIAGVLDESYPREEIVFFTGTCPGRAEEAVEAFTRWSSTLRCNFVQWLRDNSSSPPSYMFKWERHKNGVLHWHACAWVGSVEAASYITKSFKSYYYSALQHLSRLSGVDIWKRADGAEWRKSRLEVLQAEAKTVEYSTSFYVAKYVAKGAAEGSQESRYSPARWFTCSRKLSSKLREMTYVLMQRFDTVLERVAVANVYNSILRFLSNYHRQYKHHNSDGQTNVHRFDDWQDCQDFAAMAWSKTLEFARQLREVVAGCREKALKFSAFDISIQLKNWARIDRGSGLEKIPIVPPSDDPLEKRIARRSVTNYYVDNWGLEIEFWAYRNDQELFFQFLI